MALSFEESLKKAKEALAKKEASLSIAAAPAVPADSGIAVMSLEDESGMIAAYAGEDWTEDGNYVYYPDYADDNYSFVNDRKEVTISPKQINLTQENNSQFIPFEMNRYYDGFDLTTASLLIYFVNEDETGDYANPINVSYSSEKIRFGWLVDNRATAVPGKLRFEIHGVGRNSNEDDYLWKTRPCDTLEVLKSLSTKGVVEPDSTWITGFLTQVTEKVSQAQQYANQAASSSSNAKNYANQASEYAGQAKSTVSSAKTELEQAVSATVDSKVADALKSYYSSEQVDKLLEDIDVSDQLETVKSEINSKIEGLDGLAKLKIEYTNSVLSFYNGETLIGNFTIYSDPSETWETGYTATVSGMISESITAYDEGISTYKEGVAAEFESIHTTIDGIPEALENDYYTKGVSDEKFAEKSAVDALSSSVAEIGNTASAAKNTADTNKDGLETITRKVVELDTTVSGIDTSPRLTYDIAYNDAENPDVGENGFVLYEIKNEGLESEVREVKTKVVVTGGSGGGVSTTLKIEYVTKSPYVVTIDDEAKVYYNFSGVDSSGDAVLDAMYTWKIGNTIIGTGTVVAGENFFDLTDFINIGTQKAVLIVEDEAGSRVTKTWTIQKVDVRLESNFNDTLTYSEGIVSISYTPYGAIEKTIHFALDGVENDSFITDKSGIQFGYSTPSLSHGSHLLDIWMTANLKGNDIESNHIVKDLLVLGDSDAPLIGCAVQDFEVRQHDTKNITYTVFDPSTETPRVTLAVDGEVVSVLTLDSGTQVWAFKSTELGEHELTITCGETVKVLRAVVVELGIEIEPVTAGLAFDFNPVGRSNASADRIWYDGDVHMTVSDNFDWVNGGYQIDAAGDTYFCIKAGTSAVIDYKLFADDAKRNGKEFKLVFKTTNVQEANAKFLTCVDNTTGTDHIGVEMFAHEAFIYGSAADKLNLKYSENDIIEFEFNITQNTEKVPEICGYEDGVATRHLVYDNSFGFTQVNTKDIVLGSDKCDLHIYRFKVYGTSLTDKGVLNNFIADARNASEMIRRHDRNQIYNENQELTPETLAEKCPWLRVYVLSAPYFTNKKSDKVPHTTIRQIYKNGDPVLDNWVCYDCSHSGQGTSSDNYGAAARNLDYIMNESQIEGVEPYFILGDGKTTAEKISLTRTSIPVAYLNFKANVASSNHFTNALLAKRYNTYNPYIRPFVREDESIIDYIKDTMEFHNAVVFIQETDPDLSTHREFADNLIHFYSIGNIGDSKKTDDTRLTDSSDRYEFINEICDIKLPLSDWPNTEEAIAALEAEKFDKSGSYEWRYIWKNGTDEENAVVFDYCKQKWIDMYKFVVQSTDEEFKAHLGDYFVLDSVLYYYLFTTRYCMVDNRAKNSFWHYGKTGEVDVDGNPIRKFDLSFMYDCDSSMSLNNYGNSVYRHGYEDTDTMDGTNEEVFRESDSTFFCRVRENFGAELEAMYNSLESKNAWHAESFLNEIEEWQKQFPEELWRVACQRTYIRSYSESFISGEGDPQFLKKMAQGRMLYAVKEWERSQEAYMASKYRSSRASSDNAVLRCTVPEGDLAVPVNYRLKLTPYDHMYLNVKYGTQEPISLRAKPGITYEIPFEGDSVDIIDIYSVSRIQDLGDLSSTYPATVDTARASRLKELHVGSSVEGYDNPYLTTMTLGANYLLEVLNVENVSGLTQSLDLSVLNNLRELYAHGTNTGGVEFASGGAIRTAELPAITALSARNLSYLTNLDISSYDRLTTLTVENCSVIDVLNILENAPALNRVRITGVNWVLEDANVLKRIYGMKGMDKDGYNLDQSVLSGSVRVSVIYQQELNDYRAAWPDLEIVPETTIPQYVVRFKNYDGTVLHKQYVTYNDYAEDPGIIPTKESSVEFNYTFIGWDKDPATVAIFQDTDFVAQYSESTRTYTVKYVSMNETVEEFVAPYGSYVECSKVPSYDKDEDNLIFRLFKRWKTSGIVDGDKTIEAEFDEYMYSPGLLETKFEEMTPVQIYAFTRLYTSGFFEDVANVVFPIDGYMETGSSMQFRLGEDADFDDVESQLLIDTPIDFYGENYVEFSDVLLFDKDKDFIFAMDYEFDPGCADAGILMECYSGIHGGIQMIRSDNGTSVNLSGTSQPITSTAGKREVILFRHKKGENFITAYSSNLGMTDDTLGVYTLKMSDSIIHTECVRFGCGKMGATKYNYASGRVSWAKVWYADLGDAFCRRVVTWAHENMTMEICSFPDMSYVVSGKNEFCTFALLSRNVLCIPYRWNSTMTNSGGFGSSELCSKLNNRVYHAFPTQIKSLMKKVQVKSSAGDNSTSISKSDCYIAPPAVIELDSSKTSAPYEDEGKCIDYMLGKDNRRKMDEGGIYRKYWTRSPYVFTSSTTNNRYAYVVAEDGTIPSGTNTSVTSYCYMLPMIFI